MGTPYLTTYLEWFNKETGTVAEALRDKELKKRISWLVEEALSHSKNAVPYLVDSLKYIFANRLEAKDDFRLKMYECSIKRINWKEIAARLIEQNLEKK